MKNTKEGPVIFDAVIVLGKNIGLGWTSSRIRKTKNKLSPHSIITVLAAGHLYELGIAKKLIFSGGYTAGNDMPSEAEAMVSYLSKKFDRIPKKDIMLEEHSLNTVSNARFVRQIIRSYGFQTVAVMTVSPHTIRAEKIFKGQGIEAVVLSSENILKGRSKRDARLVSEYRNSRLVYLEIVKENLLRFWSFFDKKYTIPHMITTVTRS